MVGAGAKDGASADWKSSKSSVERPVRVSWVNEGALVRKAD